MRSITVGNSGVSSYAQYDDVNKTITDMGGNTIGTNAGRWCSCRYSSSFMWDYDSYGCLSFSSFYYGLTLLSVCSLRIA